MKYFCLIALICIFQSMDISIACYGYGVELTDYKNGDQNILKIEKGAKFEVTSDCRVIASANATIDRKITSALISFKAISNSVDFVTVRNIEMCKAMSDYNIFGVECPPPGPGRALVGIGGDIDFSSYGPLIGFFVGNLTVLVKICYDGDEGGYSLDLVEVQSGPDNNIKFKEIIEARVTDDCRTVGAAYLTIERPFTSALISIKIRQGSTDLFTIKNKELGAYLSNIDINGLEYPILEAGTVLIRFAERANISEYGPFLGFIAGQINVLLKVCYDGNEYNPDVFAMVINITRKNSISSVY